MGDDNWERPGKTGEVSSISETEISGEEESDVWAGGDCKRSGWICKCLSEYVCWKLDSSDSDLCSGDECALSVLVTEC